MGAVIACASIGCGPGGLNCLDLQAEFEYHDRARRDRFSALWPDRLHPCLITELHSRSSIAGAASVPKIRRLLDKGRAAARVAYSVFPRAVASDFLAEVASGDPSCLGTGQAPWHRAICHMGLRQAPPYLKTSSASSRIVRSSLHSKGKVSLPRPTRTPSGDSDKR